MSGYLYYIRGHLWPHLHPKMSYKNREASLSRKPSHEILSASLCRSKSGQDINKKNELQHIYLRSHA